MRLLLLVLPLILAADGKPIRGEGPMSQPQDENEELTTPTNDQKLTTPNENEELHSNVRNQQEMHDTPTTSGSELMVLDESEDSDSPSEVCSKCWSGPGHLLRAVGSLVPTAEAIAFLTYSELLNFGKGVISNFTN